MVNAHAWAQDFTHVRFGGEEHYLAVVLDLETRQVVGWRLGTRHSSELTLAAVLDALSKYPAPAILHSDQGSEYLSYKHQELCSRMEITLSCSKRASPWQNGFMERWFGNFKLELGNPTNHRDVAELHEAIALKIFYYNTKRIHDSTKDESGSLRCQPHCGYVAKKRQGVAESGSLTSFRTPRHGLLSICNSHGIVSISLILRIPTSFDKIT
jgi:transposase InsO family protein